MRSNPSRVSLEALKRDRSTRRRAIEAPVRPKGCIRRVQRLYNGCTTVVQGIGKGPTRSQHAHNTVATPEQCRSNRLAPRLQRAWEAVAYARRDPARAAARLGSTGFESLPFS